ncbi:MAG: 30S ribosomal protein S2 [Candidatus Falkowbacteria bacterium]
MYKIPIIEEMLQAGVHFGHKVSRWHPKMEQFIFGDRQGVHIINLEKTQTKLEEAFKFINEVVSKSGTILFLGTKPQAKEIIRLAATDAKMPYVNERWLGGTFTNFKTISALLKKFRKEKAAKATGDWEKYTKKERLERERALTKMDASLAGMEGLEALPAALFVVDCQKDKTAIREAKKMRIPVIGICDTNINPEIVDYPIPGNDDATKSLQLLVGAVSNAVKESKDLSTKSEALNSKQISNPTTPAGGQES